MQMAVNFQRVIRLLNLPLSASQPHLQTRPVLPATMAKSPFQQAEAQERYNTRFAAGITVPILGLIKLLTCFQI